VEAGIETGRAALRDQLFLPNIHPDAVRVLTGGFQPGEVIEALGVVETQTVAAALLAADAGLKGAAVRLHQLRLADGLGGKGLAIFSGLVADVEAAVEISTALVAAQLVRQVVISQLHAEMWENVNRVGRFGEHFGWPPV
jgi:hypothetical protein